MFQYFVAYKAGDEGDEVEAQFQAFAAYMRRMVDSDPDSMVVYLGRAFALLNEQQKNEGFGWIPIRRKPA